MSDVLTRIDRRQDYDTGGAKGGGSNADGGDAGDGGGGGGKAATRHPREDDNWCGGV